MTLRKPRGMSYPDWTELQIRAGQRDGAFVDLPGAGKPIPDIDRPRGELEWIASYLARENVDVTTVLPPALALAKEVELLPARLAEEPDEHRVREIIAEVNSRIHRAHRIPHDGPQMRVWEVDADRAVARWQVARAQRPHPAAPQSLAPAPVPAPAAPGRFKRLIIRLNRPVW